MEDVLDLYKLMKQIFNSLGCHKIVLRVNRNSWNLAVIVYIIIIFKLIKKLFDLGLFTYFHFIKILLDGLSSVSIVINKFKK